MRMILAGLGYAGGAIAEAALAAGFAVTGTARDPARAAAPAGVGLVGFAQAGAALAGATHLVVTASPEEAGCPVLAAHAEAVATAPALRWIGYLSTTGVYGDRGGAVVEEATPPAPGQARSVRRLEAEEAWRDLAAARGLPLDLFRIGGIYGPGRSAIEDMRSGRARRIRKPGQMFSRIHRDDIARAVVAAALRPGQGARVLHLVDDEPAANADVVAEAARLLGMDPPPEIPFDQAARAMSPMALSFWAENRRIANTVTKAALGLEWRYPSYREGLAALMPAANPGSASAAAGPPAATGGGRRP